ncbi:MAG: hypothetical protein QOE70_1962 [Chthoniobacter sp.]|jgi:uncharacterized protein (DUF2235 family)|nr:hypothetical protein [Chthoniobacter sp.]
MEANPAQVISKQSASADLVASDQKQRVPQRLVVCLDGTWNKRDSGTNIYHLSNLIQEGEVTDDQGSKWLQRVYYDEGVGTGLLDGVTGGALGIGLSANVREAYDWLLEQYYEGNQIYVFGFSRGAFTARSLVGLIAKCGLLRRGAPVSPDELWSAYQILGRHRHKATGAEPAENWWERLAGKPKKPFRELHELQPDWWEESDPGPFSAPANRAEELLVKWSRRVPIHCVGVFDTVGSMGLDALAIPWARDFLAQFHDTRLTGLVINGFHALAIDEHRANFSHIPWHRETSAAAPVGQTLGGGKIEQRWFAGAHSNVGGGYEDDLLSLYSLRWMIQETRALGLEYRERLTTDPDPEALLPYEKCIPLLVPEKGTNELADKPAHLRDSFDEFASGFWRYFIRGKRNYRRIGPGAELQNGTPMQSVHETLDGSVPALLAADQKQVGGLRYDPPNLWRYRKDQDPTLAVPAPAHRYMEAGLKGWIWLAVWLVLISVTGCMVGGRIDHIFRLPGGLASWRWLALIAPLVALFADYRESVLNHRTALEPEGMEAERRHAWMDAYVMIRLWAIAAAAIGAIFLAVEILWPWLLRDVPPSASLLWLIALDLLCVHFLGAAAWCAAPMTDAGLGSILQLQFTSTPAQVLECLKKWAGNHPGDQGRPLLTPVMRTLWRDILGFIPIYATFLFVGAWVALSLLFLLLKGAVPAAFAELLSSDPCCWLPALAIALLPAAADLIEDRLHLGYLRNFPSEPGATTVRTAFLATWAKIILLIIGLGVTAAGMLGLAVVQLWAAVRLAMQWATSDPLWGNPSFTAGTLSLLAAIIAGVLIYAIGKAFAPARKRPSLSA